MSLNCVNNIRDFFLAVIVLLMMVAPISYMTVKLLLILLVVFINFITGSFKVRAYNPAFYFIFLLILLYGVWNISNAIIKDSIQISELLSIIPFNLFWPFLYYALVISFAKQTQIPKCIKLLIFAHICIVFLNFYNIIALLYGLPIFNIDNEHENFRYDEAFLGISTNSLHQLVFTTPFFFMMGFAGKIRKWIFYLIGFLTVSVNIMSSRTLLLLVSFLSFLLPLLLSKKICCISRQSILRMSIVFLILGGGYLFRVVDQVYIDSSVDYYLSHFDSGDDIRYEQRDVLIQKWKEAPLTGHGSGTKFRTKAKGLSDKYESSYHAILAYNGIVGFGIFSLYIFLIVKLLYERAVEDQNVFYMACLVGLCFFLLGASTNPLLGTFDRLFPIYICLACLFVHP